MPTVRDPDDSDAPESTIAAVLGGDSDVVAFLDAPTLDIADLTAAIVDAFSRLATDAVLTVFSASIDASDVVDLTAPHGIELVHAVPHTNGTTFILRRAP